MDEWRLPRLSPSGVTLSILSVMVLCLISNWVAGALLAGTILFYAVVYTMWLKRSTPQNIVIGGAAGALPPMIGYAVTTGSVTWASFVLFSIIFMWTPPHFWALALVKSDEYAKAGIPMMPNVKGADRTRTEILVYTILLAPLGCLPYAMGLGGSLYGGDGAAVRRCDALVRGPGVSTAERRSRRAGGQEPVRLLDYLSHAALRGAARRARARHRVLALSTAVPTRPDPRPGLVLTPEQQRSRRVRNIAIGLAVGALVLLFYVITIVKLGSHVFTMFQGA